MDGLTSHPTIPSQSQPETARDSQPARQSCGAWYGQCTGISRTLLEDNPVLVLVCKYLYWGGHYGDVGRL